MVAREDHDRAAHPRWARVLIWTAWLLTVGLAVVFASSGDAFTAVGLALLALLPVVGGVVVFVRTLRRR